MKNRLTNRLACAIALTLMAGLAHAQSAPPPPMVEAVPAAVAAPMAAPAPAPTSTPPAPVVEQVAPAFSSMSVLDDHLGNDDLVRDIARYRTRESRIDAMSDLEKAQLEREKDRIQARLDLMELQALMANGGKKPEEKVADAPAPGTPAAAAAIAAAYQPQPVVRSIYGHGENSFAEIYIGSAKIVATKGTVLATGERIVDISPAGVVVIKRGRRQVLQVVGSAGTQPFP